MFKADVETSTLAESSENFSGSGGWSVLEYRGIRSSVSFISFLPFFNFSYVRFAEVELADIFLVMH